jgi:pentalenene synthase
LTAARGARALLNAAGMIAQPGASVSSSTASPARPRRHCLVYPSSWRPTLNPHAARSSRAAAEWFRALGVVHDEPSRRILEEERADLYGGLPYPRADFEHLTTLMKFLALWMLFDDLVTERTGAYFRARGPTIEDYAAALRGDAPPPRADPFLRAYAELGRAFAARMSPAWCARLADQFAAWIRMTIRERETYAALRAERRLPDPATYLEIRSVTVGVIPTFHFIEYAEGFELPPAVVDHPLVRALHTAGMQLELLSNDLASLEKDMASSWPNMVTVIQAAERISLPDAVERVVRMHNDVLADFLATEARLPDLGPAVDPLLRVYVERMHHVVRGFAEFQLRAERYRWKAALAPGRAPFAVEIASLP